MLRGEVPLNLSCTEKAQKIMGVFSFCIFQISNNEPANITFYGGKKTLKTVFTKDLFNL